MATTKKSGSKVEQAAPNAGAPKNGEKKKFNFLRLGYLFILMVAFYQIYQYVYDKKIFLGGDNAIYYVTGKAIAEGHGYTSIHSPGMEPANHYPPGYPFMAGVMMKLFGDDIQVMKKANGFFLFLSIIALFLLIEQFTANTHLAFVVSIVSMLNVHILYFSTIAMSEVPFMFASLFAILFLLRVKWTEKFFKDYNFWVFMAFLMLTYYIRTQGLALVFGAMVYVFFKSNWKNALIIFGAFLLFAFPWYLRNQSLGGNNYVRQLMLKNPYQPELGSMASFSDWSTRFFNNAERYTNLEIPSAMMSFQMLDFNKEKETKKSWTTGIVFLLLGLYGLIRLPKEKWILVGYLVASFGIFLLWPDVWYGTRFMLPVIPLMYLLAAFAVWDILRWLLQKGGITNQSMLLAFPLSFLFFIPVQTEGVEQLHKNASGVMHPKYQRYIDLANWAKFNIPPESIVSCRKPELFFLFSNKKSTYYKYTLDADSLILDLQNRGVTHVVIEQLGFASTGRYLFPAYQKHMEKFKLLQRLAPPDTYLFEMHYDLGYKGPFVDGKREGFGTCTYPDGTIYEGEWKANTRSGQGKFKWANGMSFEGGFQNNLRNGPGVLFMADGKKLEASWVNDTIRGYGKLISPDGKVEREGMMDNNNFLPK